MNWTHGQSDQGSYNCLMFGLCISVLSPGQNFWGPCLAPFSILWRPFEIFEGHFLPSVKHYPLHFFYKSWTCPIMSPNRSPQKNGCYAFFRLSFEPISNILWVSLQIKNRKCCFQTKTVKINAKNWPSWQFKCATWMRINNIHVANQWSH